MKQFLLFSFSSWFLVIGITPVESSLPTVQTDKTKFTGITMLSYNLRSISAFLGIPYAEPPIGELRFKPPIPKQKWSANFNATSYGKYCVQVSAKILGHEDCLYINIFKPTYPFSSGKLPVIVYIHGGAFILGSGNVGPEKFLTHDIIFVSMNYRLGPFGFFSTGDSSSPGNYGLLDQVLAMKWVKKNIIYFGGDPEKITVAGNSAGAISATAHLFSPMTEGLFHALIAQSGTIFMPSVLDFNPLANAKKFAHQIGCPENSTMKMVECLRRIPVEHLINITSNFKIEHTFQYVPLFLPVIDGSFLSANPEELLRNGSFHRVPILTGINRDEGLTFYGFIQKDVKKLPYNGQLPAFKLEYAKILIQSHLDFNEVTVDNIISAVREKFFQKINLNDPIGSERIFGSLLTEALFAAPASRLLQYTSQLVPSYLYEFDYVGNSLFDYWKQMYEGSASVIHGEEILYLFHGMFSIFKLTQNDRIISNLFIDLWTNFCQHGDPSPNGNPVKWNPYNISKKNFLRIDLTTNMSDGFHEDHMLFFNEILPKIMEESQHITSNVKFETMKSVSLMIYAGLTAIALVILFYCLPKNLKKK